MNRNHSILSSVFLYAFFLSVTCTSAHAQNRAMGAQEFILDDGLSHTLTLLFPGPGPGPASNINVNFPTGGGSLVPLGTTDGQMLRWNNGTSLWETTSLLTVAPTGVVGMGTATPTGGISRLDMEDNVTTTSSNFSAYIHTTMNPSGAPTGNSYGLNVRIESAGSVTWPFNAATYGIAGRGVSLQTGANSVYQTAGVIGDAENLGSATVNNAWGSYGQIINNGSGTITNGEAFHAQLFNFGPGNITNAVDFHATISSGGVANMTGLLIDQLGTGTVANTAILYDHATVPFTVTGGGIVGIGTAAPAGLVSRLDIEDAPTGTSQNFTASLQSTANPASSPSGNYYGFGVASDAASGVSMPFNTGTIGIAGRGRSLQTGANSVYQTIGVLGDAELLGSATTTNAWGTYGQILNNSTGTMTNAEAVHSQIFNFGTGAITNAIDFHATVSAGSVGNMTGLLIDQLGTGTVSNTAILYNHSTSPFIVTGAGQVGVGNASPLTTLDVQGDVAIRESGNFNTTGLGTALLGVIGVSFSTITADPGGTSISGLLGSVTTGGVEGQIFILYNDGNGPLTINNEDGSATANTRIRTMSGANLVTSGEASFTFIYHGGTLNRWILLSKAD
jgi:hypothetical protein